MEGLQVLTLMPDYTTKNADQLRSIALHYPAGQTSADTLPLRFSASGCRPPRRLLAQAKAFNNLAIPIRVPAVKIVQQTPTLVYHHDQPAAGCVVFYVGLEVRRQIVDPLAQKSDLHFW